MRVAGGRYGVGRCSGERSWSTERERATCRKRPTAS